MQKKYFSNLNGLRFIAAFLVLIHHVEQTKDLSGLNNSFSSPTILLFGSLGVTLFFVLSGFLISYILISEKEQTGTIQIRKFYTRRILRIWPLYFLFLILGLFILPRITFFYFPGWSQFTFLHYGIKIVLFLFVLPNVALILYTPIPYLKQTWSIGVEEQFYIIWPHLIKRSNNYLQLFLLVTVFFMFSTFFLFWLTNQNFLNNSNFLPFLNFLKQYFLSFRVGCMAIGGVGAYYAYFKNKNLLKIIFSTSFQLLVYFILIFCLLRGITIKYIQNEFYSTLFAILILNISCNDKSIVNLNLPIFEFLGKISFGLYMFHPIAIILSFKILNYSIGNQSIVNNFFLYILTILITTIFASLSYKYFESFFLKFKTRFSVG